ncbi:polysaccharide biosynthesis tyrosine autokinase [Alteromonas sp. NFXS44]|uniref:GumC family protein n=1 Tax=Alteromonas sp. NFXS44 TaxID=2818435 RepID=UPI0032DFAF04
MQLMEASEHIKVESSSIDVLHYFKILRRRKWVIIIVTAIISLIGLFYAKTTTPVYEATVKIQADPIQPNPTAQDQYIMSSMVFLFYETQYEIIQSRKVAETVVDKLNLVERFKAEIETKSRTNHGEFLTDIRELFYDEEAQDENSQTLTDDQLRTILAQGIKAGISVSGGTQSQVINISYQNEDPELAARIVNAVSEAYIEFGLEARLSQLKDTAQWLTEQLQELKSTLQTSENKLRQFRVNQNLMDTDQQQRIANTQLQTLNTELVRAQTGVSEAKELYEQVVQIEKNNQAYTSLGPVLQSNTIRDLVREESLLNRKVEELTKRYGEKHPKMIAARSDLQTAQANLNSEAKKIAENMKKDYKAALSQEENIRKLISETTSSLQNYQGNSFELERLERDVENNRRIYESFLAKLMEADVSGNYEASNIRIIDSATIPDFPIKPRVLLIIIASMIVGVFLGIILALIKEFTGRVFRTPDQFEEELSVASLGLTPFVKSLKKNESPALKYAEDNRSTFAEAINTIRTGILFSDIEAPPQVILVTSSNSEEGKTTLSCNLANAFSQMDKTLLIELDLRKPSLTKNLNLNPESGLVDFITGKESLNIIKYSPELDVITSGAIPKNPMEILSSRTFKTLVEKLRTEYKYIILDSPPILPVSDSLVIAKSADMTILAVRAEKTKIATVKETLNRLRKVNTKVSGIVLTQASPQKMSYYGDHYYQNEYYGTK